MEELVEEYYYDNFECYDGGVYSSSGLSYNKVHELARLVYNKAIEDCMEILKSKVDGE